MTHHEIKTLEDGTRVYSNGRRYKPKAPEERVYAKRKPEDPRAVRFGGDWYLPLELVDEQQRELPPTRPDEETLEHNLGCICEVCRRPEARRYWRRARRAS